MTTGTEVVSPAYGQWLAELKNRYRSAQIKAAVAVNRELLRFYWDLGRDIELRFGKEAGYGTGFFDRLSADLSRAIPEARGFSPANLRYCRRFWRLYAGGENLQQPAEESAAGNLQQLVEELSRVPWGHHVRIIDRCDGDRGRALFYVRKTLANNWSRNVLLHFLETDLHAREGKALTNFPATLPAPQSDLARETLKAPYKIDFVDIAEETTERDLENALVSHVAEFLVELGAGFAYVGRQVRVKVGGEEFRLDLLFYHLKLRCYVVVELKAGPFRPDHRPAPVPHQGPDRRRIRPARRNPSHGRLRVPDRHLGTREPPRHPADHRRTRSRPFRRSLPMTPAVHDRPARGAEKVFQRLEKNFPIIGKNGAIFPTIGKKVSNHWKKPENFFQSLENRRKIFPIVGKLWRSFHVCRVRVNTIYPIVGIILTPIREKGAAA